MSNLLPLWLAGVQGATEDGKNIMSEKLEGLQFRKSFEWLRINIFWGEEES